MKWKQGRKKMSRTQWGGSGSLEKGGGGGTVTGMKAGAVRLIQVRGGKRVKWPPEVFHVSL